jgi:hypothetical protein
LERACLQLTSSHLQNDQIPRLCVDGLLDHHLEDAMEVDDAMVLLAPATSHQHTIVTAPALSPRSVSDHSNSCKDMTLLNQHCTIMHAIAAADQMSKYEHAQTKHHCVESCFDGLSF